MINWDQQFKSPRERTLVHAVWALGTFAFFGGLTVRLDDEPGVEIFVICCIISAQAAALLNYRRKPILRRVFVIASIVFWSLGFMAHRFNILGDGVYAVIVGLFVLSLAFINTRK